MIIAKLATVGLLGMIAVSALAQAPSLESGVRGGGLTNGDRANAPRVVDAVLGD